MRHKENLVDTVKFSAEKNLIFLKFYFFIFSEIHLRASYLSIPHILPFYS